MIKTIIKTLLFKKNNPFITFIAQQYEESKRREFENQSYNHQASTQQNTQSKLHETPPLAPTESRLKKHADFVNGIVKRDQTAKAAIKEKEKRLVERDIQLTDRMSGREFEVFIAQLYEDLGYQAKITPESGDQGADVIVTSQNKVRIAIQTKRYEGSVGNAAVQEVIAGRIFHKCSTSIVITNSTFTKSAVNLAKQDGKVELIDRDALSLLIYKAKALRSSHG